MYRKTISKVILGGYGSAWCNFEPNKQKNWKPVSLPVTSETHKLSIFQLHHRQDQRVTRPAVPLRGGSKTAPGRRRKLSLGACKPTFIPFIHHILRWNSTMRHCFYYTDLGQNAVFHNFAMQIALIQYSGRSKWSTRWPLAKLLKQFPKSPLRPAGSHFRRASCGRVFEWTLIELRSNIIKNLLCIFFI